MVFTLIPFTGLQEAKAATNSMTIDLSKNSRAEYRGNDAIAIYEFITIEEAEEFGRSVGCEIHKFKKGRGII